MTGAAWILRSFRTINLSAPDGATLRTRFVADRYDIGKHFSSFDKMLHCLGWIGGNNNVARFGAIFSSTGLGRQRVIHVTH